ncbi:MAG: LolA family protein [Bacteroidota bacterium]
MTARLMISVLWCITAAVAQERLTSQTVLQNVQKNYAGITSATASFVQTVTLRFGKNDQRQTGTVKIKQGNKYRVETPDQQLIADGKTVWIVSTANNQVLIDSFKENTRVFSPEKFLLGLPDEFSAKELKREQGLLKISLEPGAGSAKTGPVRTMTAWIREENWSVVRIVYTDRNRTHYDITLTDVRFNTPVNDAEFSFDPPAGMQVVDLRKVQ